MCRFLFSLFNSIVILNFHNVISYKACLNEINMNRGDGADHYHSNLKTLSELFDMVVEKHNITVNKYFVDQCQRSFDPKDKQFLDFFINDEHTLVLPLPTYIHPPGENVTYLRGTLLFVYDDTVIIAIIRR